MAYQGTPQQGQLLWTRQVEIANTAEQTVDSTVYKGITKYHWKSGDGVLNCRNKSCRKKFSLIERIHHCRRCGDIFCKTCLNFQRRLNDLAHPDPEGKLYKVCEACYEEGKDSEGQRRNLTDFFKYLRKQGQENAVRVENGRICGSWRNKLNFETEIKRLLIGFKESIGSSEMRRTIHEMATILSTPVWQKATFWMQENMTDRCQKCLIKFNLVKSKHNCKVCAKALCKSCSCKDVILFLDDEEEVKEPKIAVIRVVGSPSVEPDLALYLRVCYECLDKLKSRQISRFEEEEKMSNVKNDSLEMLIKLHAVMHRNEEKMEKQLNEYQVIIESLEDNTRKASNSGKSNIQTVAKAQEDLADFLAQYVINIQKMKKLSPESNTQAVLFRNCLKGKCDFYFDNQYRYKCLKKILGDSTPAEVLESIQRTVDKHAIVSTQLYIRQLTFETLHICDKYKLKDLIPIQLTKTDEDVEQDAAECIQCNGEDIEEHQEHMQELLQLQLKDHRLIKLSRRSLKYCGSHHAADMIVKRSTDIVNQVKIQLMLKSANRSFPSTKRSLEQTYAEVQKITVQDILP